MYSCGHLHMDGQKQDDQLKPTYSNSVVIRDVALKTSRKQWTIGRGGERASEISVLMAWHDDDDYCFTSSKFFHRRLSDNKSPQVSMNLLGRLANLNNAVVWMVSITPWLFHPSCLFFSSLQGQCICLSFCFLPFSSNGLLKQKIPLNNNYYYYYYYYYWFCCCLFVFLRLLRHLCVLLSSRIQFLKEWIFAKIIFSINSISISRSNIGE